MKKIIITTIGFLTLFAGVFSPVGKVEALAAWNAASNDYATVRVSNVTKQPNCTTCWTSSVQADAGDTIAVTVYYHNTGSTTGDNTMIRLSPSSSGGAVSSLSFSGSVSSDGAQNTATGSAIVNVTSAQPINFVTARWFPNQTTSPQALPGGQDGSTAFGSGINLGTIAPGWGSQGSVVFHFSVGSTYVPPAPTGTVPSVVTNPATNIASASALLNGTLVANGGSATSVSFEYWPASSSNPISTGVRTMGYGTGSFSESVFNLQPNTLYYFRAVARNMHGVGYGQALPFTLGGGTQGPACPVVDTVSAVAISQTSAVVNGIVISSQATPVTTWFEYGPTQSLGFSTAQRTLGTVSSVNFSSVISGLQPGTRYYYRAVVQTNCGITRDTTSRFFTTSTTVVNPVVVNTPTVRVLTANSAPSLFALRVDNRVANACIGGDSEYTIYWKNVSNLVLSDAVLQINIPEEMGYVRSSQGSFSKSENTLTIDIGQVLPGQEGTASITVRILSSAYEGQLLVVTSSMVYTNPSTGAQEDAIAYALTTVTRDCPSLLGAASLFGANFWPDTLLEWLFLILIILALIILGRRIYTKRTV